MIEAILICTLIVVSIVQGIILFCHEGRLDRLTDSNDFNIDRVANLASRVATVESKADANTCRIKEFEETKLETMQEELKQQQAMTDGMNAIFGYTYGKAVKAGDKE